MTLRNRPLAMGEKPITGLADGVEPADAVNKSQLDTVAADLQDAIDALSPAAVADGTIRSNISGGSAVSIDNGISDVFDRLLGSTQGSMAYRGASGWTPLTPGTNGKFLKTNGAGADPSWADVTPPTWTYIFKTNAQTATSSTALTDDSELRVAVTSGQTIIFRVVYFIVPGGSHQVAIDGPTASSIRVSYSTLGSSGGTMTTTYNSAFASSTATPTPQVLEAIGKVVFTASGTFTLRLAQGTSSATVTTWEPGSYLEYRLI